MITTWRSYETPDERIHYTLGVRNGWLDACSGIRSIIALTWPKTAPGYSWGYSDGQEKYHRGEALPGKLED